MLFISDVFPGVREIRMRKSASCTAPGSRENGILSVLDFRESRAGRSSVKYLLGKHLLDLAYASAVKNTMRFLAALLGPVWFW